jgi:hypothetical protein
MEFWTRRKHVVLVDLAHIFSNERILGPECIWGLGFGLCYGNKNLSKFTNIFQLAARISIELIRYV